jgi:hypothetical protein
LKERLLLEECLLPIVNRLLQCKEMLKKCLLLEERLLPIAYRLTPRREALKEPLLNFTVEGTFAAECV